MASVRSYFPDLTFAIQDLIAENHQVAARWIARCTNQEGQVIEYPGVDILHIRDGKIAELWSFFWFPESGD